MARKPKTPAEETAEVLSTPTPRIRAVKPEDLLSTGCTLLNMAISNRPRGGIPKGTYFYFVGDSSSGKTWFCFNLYAEAARNPHFAGYRFVFDNAENGALMDVERYFGKKVAENLAPPRRDKDGEPLHSRTVQEFYLNLAANVKQGPCIYVLDSMDAILDEEEEEVFESELKRHETGKGEVKGSFGVQKAKTNSKRIGQAVQSLRETGSILVVISQTRDKIGARFPTKTRAGGRALRFFAHVEAWTSVKEPIVVTYRGKDREVGAKILIDMQKNRVEGWEGKLPLINFIKTSGVDDVGSNVEYLIDEKHWKKAKKEDGTDTKKRAARSDEEGDGAKTAYAAPEFSFVGTKEEIVQKIEDDSEEVVLQKLVAQVWRDIIANATPTRKAKYE